MDYEKLSKEELIEALKESQEINKKLLELMEYHNSKMTRISISSLETQIKSMHKYLFDLEATKPPKLFKSVYNEWQKRVKEVETEIEKLDKQLYDEYTELGEYLEKEYNKKEDND